jgi:hypothetical protein
MATDASFDCVEGLLNRSLKAAFPIENRGFMDARTPRQRPLHPDCGGYY